MSCPFDKSCCRSETTLLLPLECSSHVFSFLDIKDALRFASTSKISMASILPDLNRRRLRLKQRFVYRKDWKNNKGELVQVATIIPSPEYEGKTSKSPINTTTNTKFFPTLPLSSLSSPSSMWLKCDQDPSWVTTLLLFTVEERVEQLSRHMPRCHPLYGRVRALWQELSEGFELRKLTDFSASWSSLSFEELLNVYRKVLFALQLHAEILSSAMGSKALELQRQTTLDQYIGDVLILTYLSSMSDLGLVEGGPTNASFVQSLRYAQNSGVDSYSSCYRQWVHLHSSILRMKSFTKEQRDRLGIPGELFCNDVYLSEIIPNDCYINERFLSSEMTMVFFQFGRLGPTFRLRDDLQHREISARCLFAFFVTNVAVGETAQNAIEWLLMMHEETRRARPMSVRQSLVKLCHP